MKVHFIANLEGDKKTYQRILDFISELGYELITNHSVTRSIKDVKNETLEETQLYYQKMQTWIQKADIVVVETTKLALGAGFETAFALQMGKQVIVLYKPDKENKPYVLKGSNVNNLQVLEYTDSSDLKKNIKFALEYASENLDTRFTMLLPPEIVSRLNEKAKSGISRSEYIRSLIKKDMKEKK